MNDSQIKNTSYLVVLITIISAVMWWSWRIHANPEHDVYLALISLVKVLHNESKVQENVIVLSAPSTCDAGQAHGKVLPTETFTNFLTANTDDAAPVRLVSIEGLIPIIGWEDSKKLNKLSKDNGDLRSIIFPPDGHRGFMLSRVGFNEKRTQAIMCLEIRENAYRSAVLLYFEKKNEKWIFMQSLPVWIT